MAIIDEIRKTRLKKLATIQKAGFSAYPLRTKRSHSIAEALKEFSVLEKEKKEIILAAELEQ